jgi:hypothetical protein
MRTRTILVILDFVGGLLSWAWIIAAIASVYFLYGILASGQSWPHLLWAVLAGLVSKLFSNIVVKRRHRLHFVNQLMKRGLTHADAEAAWRTASAGGSNLLRNFQQSELGEQIGRLEVAIGAQISATESGDE